jgi:hypothetical protein
MNYSRWPFQDAKNVAVFTVPAVMRGEADITHVYHHEEDGAWEFHAAGECAEENDVKVLALEEIVKLDDSFNELSSLPCGWEASRSGRGARWIKRRSPS